MRKTLLGIALAGIALTGAGCITHDPDLAAIRSKESWTQTVHYVRYAPGQSEITAEQKASLDAFLSKAGARGGDSLVLMVADIDRLAGVDISERRADTLREELAQRGLRVRYVGRLPGSELRDRVAVSLGQTVAGERRCDDWHRIRAGGDMRGDRAEFGCVVDAAVTAQIDRKSDIRRGRTPGAGDGGAAAKVVRDYRDGKLPPAQLPRPSSTLGTTTPGGSL